MPLATERARNGDEIAERTVHVESHGTPKKKSPIGKPSYDGFKILLINRESRASIVCPPIRFFRPKLGEASEWNFVGSSPARSQLLKSRKHRGFSSRICKQYFSSQISSVVIKWLGAHAIGYGPEFKVNFLDNIIANTQGLTLIFLCLGFLHL